MFPFKLLVPLLGATAMATAVAQGGGFTPPAEATTVVLVHGDRVASLIGEAAR